MSLGRAVLITIILVVSAMFFTSCQSLPEGMSTTSNTFSAEKGKLFVDNTAVNEDGERHSEQEIFDEAFRLIEQADKLIMLDMFLFNDFQGPNPEKHREVSSELTEALIAKKEAQPDLPIILITDPFNHLYDGLKNSQFEDMKDAGIHVVSTDLTKMPDSNPSWSVIWRTCCQWFGNNDEAGWLPNPVGPGKVTLRTYLTLINFKANHRKTLVVDEDDDWTTLITSANPHDGSSAHSNTALTFSGNIALAVLQSEQAVLKFSAPEVLQQVAWPDGTAPQEITEHTEQQHDTSPKVQLITEGGIEKALLNAVNTAQEGDKLRLEVFYFSHSGLQKALIKAHNRGVDIKVILDPNKDAFGREKNGIPNRQVAAKLHKTGIPIRWCNTHGEQCHSKWLLKQHDDKSELILGSSNFTRRNLSDFNLETDVRLQADNDNEIIQRASELYASRWHNQPFEDEKGERLYTTEYEEYEDNSRLRKLMYWFMEKTGWSSF